ncbi:MAG: MFS transporter, partial [Myxococcales bacterium]|nr:MFS transporter [Myxococcales bacterium]
MLTIPKMLPPSSPRPPRRTLLGIDAVYFLMADLETGVGPFLAIYLVSSRHWDASRVGLVVAVQSIVTVLTQAGAGALVDWSRHKKWLLVGGTVFIAVGCFGVVRAPTLSLQLLDQALIGIAAAVFVPAGAAVSLGVVGAPHLPRRIGRNEAMNHAGNVTFALTAAWVGAHLGQEAIFTTAAIFAFVTAVAGAAIIRARDIDDVEARGALHDVGAGEGVGRISALLSRRPVMLFVALAFLYHLANGAMLPLVGEMLTQSGGVASSYMSACIVVAQLTMVPVVLVVARLAVRGRKPIFAAAYVVLALRGVCYLLGHGPWY